MAFDNKTYQAAWYKRNAARIKEERRRHYKRNKSRSLKASAAWAKAHPEASRQIKLRWQQRNRAHVNRVNTQWRRSNPELIRQYGRMHQSRRRAKLRNQLHPQHDRAIEKAMVKRCIAVTRRTGKRHHVDHIIPLGCGGWHHHLNLQIMPALMNHRKRSDPFHEPRGYKSWRDVPRFLWPDSLKAQYERLW